MTMQLFQKQYGFENALFRQSGDVNYYGPGEQLFAEVQQYNVQNKGNYEIKAGEGCRINIGEYGTTWKTTRPS